MPKGKIVVIDDDPDVLNSMKEILKGYNIDTAKSKTSGLDMIQRLKPDLVLCDVQIPDKDEGFYVLKKVRENETTRDIPFIFITVHTDKLTIVKGFENGAQDYVFKTASEEEILARVKTHLSIKRLTDRFKRANDLNEEYRKDSSEMLREKLTSIDSSAQLLKMRYADDVKAIKYINVIERNCTDIERTIRNFLDKKIG